MSERRFGFDGERWSDLDAREDQVSGLVFRGVDPEQYHEIVRRVAEQGMPTRNRAQRRKGQRTGDHARALKRRREA
jgi:hypothetical protein